MRLGLAFSPVCTMLSIVALAVLVATLVAGEESVIEDGWLVDRDTTLSDGNWTVEGNITVARGELVIDHARLDFQPSGDYCLFVVEETASLVVRNSLFSGNETFVFMDCYGKVTFTDSQFLMNEILGLAGSLQSKANSLEIQGCLLEEWAIYVGENGTIRDTVLRGQSYGISGGIVDFELTTNFNLTMENVSMEQTTEGYGISLSGPDDIGGNSSAVIRNCTVHAKNALEITCFRRGGSVLVEDCFLNASEKGAWLKQVGTNVVLSNNVICGDIGLEYELGMQVDTQLRDNEIIGGSYGILVSDWGILNITNVSVYGVVGVHLSKGILRIDNSTINSLDFDFQAEHGEVQIRNCRHDRTAFVFGVNGRVREYVWMEVTDVNWSNGPAITEGAVSIQHSDGTQLGVISLPGLGTIEYLCWYVDSETEWSIDQATAYYWTDGERFSSKTLDMGPDTRIAVEIIDHFPPIVTVDEPVVPSVIGTSSIIVAGTFFEKGSGIASVEVSIDSGPWTVATLLDDDQYRLEPPPLTDGCHTVSVRATDRTGASTQTRIADLVTDTIPPGIDVVSPGHIVNSTDIVLTVLVEPGSTATINTWPANVSPEGLIEFPMTLNEGVTGIKIAAVDRVGNSNDTTYTIEVDVTAPLVSVYSPLPDSWIPTSSFLVSGVTEETARVWVNDIEADRQGPEFSVLIEAVEGELDLWVDVIDVAGNTKRLELRVTVDSIPPELVVSDPPDGLVTREPVVEVRGMVLEDGWLQLTVEGKTTVPSQGSWSQVLTLQEGPNEIVIKAEDGAGHIVILTRNVTLDSVAPTMTVGLVAGDQLFEPTQEEVRISRDRVNLTVQVSEPCRVKVQGVGVFDVTERSVSIELLLAIDTDNAVVMNAVDPAGNTAGSVEFVITVDRTPPELSVLEPEVDSVVYSPDVVIRGATEPGAYLTVDGRVVTVEDNGTFSLQATLEEGMNSFTLLAEDGLGNTDELVYSLVYQTADEPSDDEDGDAYPILAAAVVVVALVVVALVAVALVWYIRR